MCVCMLYAVPRCGVRRCRCRCVLLYSLDGARSIEPRRALWWICTCGVVVMGRVACLAAARALRERCKECYVMLSSSRECKASRECKGVFGPMSP